MPNYIQSHNRLKHDSQVVWRPGRVWLPVTEFSNYIGAAGVTAGIHTGAPVFQEISTFGIAGVLLDTAADEVNTYMPLPYDIDLSKRIYMRVHWTSGSSTTADTIDWRVWYKAIVFHSTTLLAIGDTGGVALDRVIAQDTVSGAYHWQVTEEGYLDAGKLSHDTEGLLLAIELHAFAAGLTEDKFPLGLEIRYSPRRLWGPNGMNHEAKATTHIGGMSEPI